MRMQSTAKRRRKQAKQAAAQGRSFGFSSK